MAIPVNLAPIAPIQPINPIASIASLEGLEGSAAGPTAGEAFHAVFTDAVAKVEQFQQNAQTSVGKFLSGEGEELHQVALAVQHAELSFDLFVQARNKVVAAYEEVMRMQV